MKTLIALAIMTSLFTGCIRFKAPGYELEVDIPVEETTAGE